MFIHVIIMCNIKVVRRNTRHDLRGLSFSTFMMQPWLSVSSLLLQLPSGTSFYGTGEVGGALERTGKRVSFLLHLSSPKKKHLVMFQGKNRSKNRRG
jgi:hypothetical protein